MTNEVTVALDSDDLMSSVEALHESLGRRIRWLLDINHPARDTVPWDTFRSHLKWMVNAFYRMRIAYREALETSGGTDEERQIAQDWIEEHMFFPPAVEKVFDQALIADDWEEFEHHPRHPVLSCEICAFTYSAGTY